MRVLVTASRTWTDQHTIWDRLDEALRQCPPGMEFVVVHGGARGGDQHADHWATIRGRTNPKVYAEVHIAAWTRYGRRAGMIRNFAMVKAGADLCLAFIRDNSAGATGCAGLAQRAGIPTTVHTWDTIQKGHR